jgi:hypothetical protein
VLAESTWSARAAYGQSRIMHAVAQRTTNTLRRDLFAVMQSLPLTTSTPTLTAS